MNLSTAYKNLIKAEEVLRDLEIKEVLRVLNQYLKAPDRYKAELDLDYDGVEVDIVMPSYKPQSTFYSVAAFEGMSVRLENRGNGSVMLAIYYCPESKSKSISYKPFVDFATKYHLKLTPSSSIKRIMAKTYHSLSVLGTLAPILPLRKPSR